MSFIGSTTAYPLAVPAGIDRVPFIDTATGVQKQSLVSALGTATSSTELKGLTFTSDTGSTTDADNSAGAFWWNNATQASATVVFFDNLTADAITATTFFAALGTIGFIYVQQSDDSTKWQLWKWTAVTAATGYYKFTVTLSAINGSIADNKTVYCSFAPQSTTWGGIIGTLSGQADLQAALDLKQNRSPSVQSIASASTITPTFSNDIVKVTALAANVTLANPTGSAIDGLGLVIRIKDNGTARTIGYGTQYRAIGVTLPTTTVIGKTVYLAMIFNTDDTKWDVVAAGQEA